MYTSPCREITSTLMNMRVIYLFLIISIGSLMVGNVGLSLCYAAKEDSFTFESQGSGGLIAGSLEVFRHFYAIKNLENNYVLDHMIDQETDGGFRPLKALPLAWNLGFNYSRLILPSGLGSTQSGDDVVSGKLGLDWQVSGEFGFYTSLTVGGIPEENYTHDSVAFRLEYLFRIWTHREGASASSNLGPHETAHEDLNQAVQPAEKNEEEDASRYYQKEREDHLRKLDIARRQALLDLKPQDSDASLHGRVQDDHYPNIKVAYHFVFDNHQINTSVLTETLAQYKHGPEISYSPSDSVILTAAVDFSNYNSSVDQFISLMKIGAVLHTIGEVGNENQFLTFPSLSYSVNFDWYLDDKDSFNLKTDYCQYASVLQANTIRSSPLYYRDLSRSWRLGAGAHLLFDTGTLAVTYLASLQLIYKF